MKTAIYVVDYGEFTPIDLSGYVPHIIAEVNKAGDEIQGIRIGLRIMPSFRKALFAVNGMCFVAELQTVYVGENGESRRVPFVGGHRIGKMHIEPIENREAMRLLSMNIAAQFECVAKVFKTATDRFREAIRIFESLSLELERVENTTIHNR